jgi:hypothetical protein
MGAQLPLCEQVSRLRASFGELNYPNVADFDALAVGAVCEYVGTVAVGGDENAKALERLVEVLYSFARHRLEVAKCQVGEGYRWHLWSPRVSLGSRETPA